MSSMKGGMGEAAADRITSQVGDVTRLKVDNLRHARHIKQLQERETFLEGNCQQLEQDMHRLEEQLVSVQTESESKANETADKKVAELRAHIADLEAQLAAASKVAPPSATKRAVSAVKYTPPAFAQMEARSMDYSAIAAMKEEVERLGGMLQDKEDEVGGTACARPDALAGSTAFCDSPHLTCEGPCAVLPIGESSLSLTWPCRRSRCCANNTALSHKPCRRSRCCTSSSKSRSRAARRVPRVLA
jgi:uncharacterized small protein (DUF1192 family)